MSVNTIPKTFGSGGSGLNPTADPTNNLQKILSDHATAINTLLAGNSGAVPDGVTITGAGTIGSPLVAAAQFGPDTTIKLPNSSAVLVNAWQQIVTLSTNTPGSEASQVVLKLLVAGAQTTLITITSTTITFVPALGITSGNQSNPGIFFNAETGLGIYRVGGGSIGFAGSGAPLAFMSTGILNIVGSNAQLQLSSAGTGISVSTASLSLNAGSTFHVFVNAARFQQAKGSNVAATQPLVLGTDGNYFVITGTTGIQGIVTTKWLAGAKLSLELASGITITHNAGAPGASAAAILLRAGANLTTSATYVLELYFNGTNWIQPS